MNIAFKLIFISILLTSFVSCNKDSDPETVYRNYLASIQAMSSMTETDYQRFISERAQTTVKNKISAIEGAQLDKILILFKAEAVLPENSQINIVSENNGSTILKIVVENYPEEGSRQEQNVSFVNENGWKIDKIEITTIGEDFEFKSTTY